MIGIGWDGIAWANSISDLAFRDGKNLWLRPKCRALITHSQLPEFSQEDSHSIILASFQSSLPLRARVTIKSDSSTFFTNPPASYSRRIRLSSRVFGLANYMHLSSGEQITTSSVAQNATAICQGERTTAESFRLGRAESKTPELLTALIKLLRVDASSWALNLLLGAAWIIWFDIRFLDLSETCRWNCLYCAHVGSRAIFSTRPSEYFPQICWATIILFMQVLSERDDAKPYLCV